MRISPLLFIDRRQEGLRTWIIAAGALDLDSAPVLADAFARELKGRGTADLHVDLSGVAFCDCVGLSALLTAAHDTRAAGRAFQAHSPVPAVLRLFGLTGATDILLSRSHAPREAAAAG
ncbi:STAS domain-containing protein [Streptomyces sp. NPDC055808]